MNTYYTWSSSGLCTTPSYTMDYLMRHEFGHWVVFRHPSSSETSVMVSGYDCNKWNSIKTHDSDSLTSIYG